jgi:hypothetical protein
MGKSDGASGFTANFGEIAAWLLFDIAVGNSGFISKETKETREPVTSYSRGLRKIRRP